MGWKKVGIGEVIDLKRDGEGTETIGVYTGRQEGVGQNNSVMHSFTVDGKNVQAWGSTVLDARLELVQPGTKVKIVYLGVSKSNTPGRKGFHNFDVYEDDGTATSTQGKLDVETEDASDVPF